MKMTLFSLTTEGDLMSLIQVIGNVNKTFLNELF